MSSGPVVIEVPGRFQASRRRAGTAAATGERPWIRLLTFAALTLYGVQRWATLLRPAPTARLLGIVALAIGLAGLVPLVRRFHPAPAGVCAGLLMFAAFPVAGVGWQWTVHLRIALAGDRIGNGLEGLPSALVPYLGHNPAVRLVIVLGAAVLALDAAAVLAFAPRAFGDARRAAAALPLIALAVVPSTLVRPGLPYLQGLLLFALVAAFVWGERLRADAVASALAIALVAGIGAAILAPRIDQHHAWVDYRAWAGTVVHERVDTFDWNQTYGPLHWPHSGHEVLTVSSPTKDYWKAEDLDTFNGYDWVLGTYSIAGPLPSPSPRALARWSHTIDVSIEGMETSDVIAAGDAAEPSLPILELGAGADPGTWVTDRPLGPGTSYAVDAYSPHPSARTLNRDRSTYPAQLLSNDLMLTIPAAAAPATNEPLVVFAPFHTGSAAVVAGVDPYPDAAAMLAASPYAGAYALARRLAARAATPYAFVQAVMRYLSTGFTYDQNPRLSRYPLETFLFGAKDGYCQQFSGAMAMLLRMGGVPARVAAGFTSGTYDATDHRYVVSDTDAHAWVEVWFPHYGWVRFDPTPVSAPARGGSGAIPAILKTLPGEKPAATSGLRREIGAAGTSGSTSHAGGGGGLSDGLIGLAVALAAVATGLLAVILRGGDSPDELVAELERALARARRPLGEGITLAALETRFAGSPDAAAYVRALRLARYGGRPVRPSAAQRRALRRELRRGLGLSGAIRSLWALPPRPHRFRTRPAAS